MSAVTTLTYWQTIQRAMPASWKATQDKAVKALSDQIAANTDAAAAKVKAYLEAMGASRRNLARMKRDIEAHPELPHRQEWIKSYEAMLQRYKILMSGVYGDAVQVEERMEEPAVAAVPVAVVVIIGTVGITIVGVAFAIAAYHYATALLAETQVQSDELTARVEAMRKGTTLQESTLPDPPSDSKTGLIVAGVLIGGAALAAGAYAARNKFHGAAS